MVNNSTPAWIVIIILAAIWELGWKGAALWKTAREGKLRWFLAILLINTIGILPILYLLYDLPRFKNSLK